MSMPKAPDRRHRNRLPDSRAGSGRFDLRLALHRLQRHAGHPAGRSSICPSPTTSPHDEEARSMMHNAACIAALAFSNASVGVNHALAHAFGARFGIAARPRQRAHAAARDLHTTPRCRPSSCRRRTSAAMMPHKKYATDGGSAGAGRPHGGREGAEADCRHRATAGPSWRFRAPSPSWASRARNSSAPCPSWPQTAFDDPSWRSNPRMPLVSELAELFRLAYQGRGQSTAAGASA